MANERLIGDTGLVNVSSEEAIGGTAKQLAWNWRTSAVNKEIKNIYVKMTSAGEFAAGTRAQLWKRNVVIALSSLEIDVEIGGMTGTPGDRIAVPGVPAYALTQSQDYMGSIFHPASQTGNNWYAAGFGDPDNGLTMTGNCIYYDTSATASTPPQYEGFTDGAFGIDIEIGDISGHSKGAEFLSFF